MKIVENLSAIALRPFLDGAAAEGTNGTQALGPQLRQHPERVREALGRACERAWKTLEVALAGRAWWEKSRKRLAPSEEAVLGHKVPAFFAPELLGEVLTQEAAFRQQSLHELRAAHRTGLLRGDIERLDDILDLLTRGATIEDEQRLLGQMADELRAEYPALARTLALRTPDGQAPLAKLVRCFFRRQTESNPELAEAIPPGTLPPLDERERSLVDAIAGVLAHHANKLDRLLGTAAPRRTRVELTAKVLDIEAETQREEFPVPQLGRYVLRYLEKFQLIERDLPALPGLTIAGEADRKQIAKLAGHVHELKDDRLRALPALLHGLGLLEAAAGLHEAAQSDLHKAAQSVTEPGPQASIYYRAYQAAIDAGARDAALANLTRAARLDPRRFAPLPLDKYEVERLLHVDLAGMRFQCKHRLAGTRVVIRTLLTDNLALPVGEIFQQAKLLDEIDNPCRMHLRDHDFADEARLRPYLVTDYFDGITLAEQLQSDGPLAPADLVRVVRPLAELLRAAHERGILHRHLEPSCLLLRKEDANWKTKLVDFGHEVKPALALSMLGGPLDAWARSENAAQALRTLPFLAPEQLGLSEGATVGPASDVYGFGRLCYFALLGTPEPDDEQKRTLPEPLRKLLGRCTARLVSRRLHSFEVIVKALAALPEGPGMAPAAEPRSEAAELQHQLSRGMAFKQRGDNDKAIAAFTKAIQLDPKQVGSYVKRGNAYLDAGDCDRALADYATVLKLDPENAVAHMNRALVHAKKGEFDAVIAECAAAIRLDPKLAAAYSIRGAAFWERGDRHRAIAEFSLAIRFDAKNALAYNGRGLAYQEDKEYDRALHDYTEALKHDPRLVIAYVNRGNLFRLTKRPDEAIRDYTRALQVDPRNVLAYFNRALAHMDKQAFDHGIADFSRVLQLDPKHPEAATRREDAVRALEKVGAVVPAPEKPAAARPAPAAAPAKNPAATAAARPVAAPAGPRKDLATTPPPAPAKSPAEKAEEERRQIRAAAYFAAARSAYDQGNYAPVVDQYSKALQVDPEDPLIFYHRGLAHLAQDDFAQALADFTDTVRHNPKDAMAYYQRGVALRLLGQHDKAIEDYTQALKLDPRLALAYRNRSQVYAAKGDSDKAKADFDRAVRLDPKLAKEG